MGGHFLIFLFFLLPWRWRWYVPPKRRLTPHLHGATSQKTALFIVTAVKTSNLTHQYLFPVLDSKLRSHYLIGSRPRSHRDLWRYRSSLFAHAQLILSVGVSQWWIAFVLRRGTAWASGKWLTCSGNSAPQRMKRGGLPVFDKSLPSVRVSVCVSPSCC
jgi:hypothetical protein